MAVVLTACNSYERNRETMIREIITLGYEDSVQHKRTTDLEYMLAEYLKAAGEGNLMAPHLLTQAERSANDIKQLDAGSFTEFGLLSGSAKKTAAKVTSIDVYERDMKRIAGILKKMGVADQNEYVSHLLKRFNTAQKKCEEEQIQAFAGMFAALFGDNSSLTKPHKVVHAAYHDAYEYTLSSADRIVSDYVLTILTVIRNYSARLKFEEFTDIFIDLVNNSASEYLGANIFQLAFDTGDDRYFQEIKDLELIYEKYRLLSP